MDQSLDGYCCHICNRKISISPYEGGWLYKALGEGASVSIMESACVRGRNRTPELECWKLGYERLHKIIEEECNGY